jgi:hypothetical protein
MGVPRLPTLLLFLVASSLAFGQDPGFASSPAAPAARIGLMPGAAADTLPAPVLPAPGAATIPGAITQPLPGEFHPSNSFVAPHDPNCCSGGCDGDCQPCRRLWLDAAFFIGSSADNLPGVDRQYLYGWQVAGGFWFDDMRSVGLEFDFFDAHGSWRRVPGPYLIDSPVTLMTFDANIRGELFTVETVRVDWLLGYRYAQLHERYFVGTTTVLADLAVRDQINAPQIGLAVTLRYGPYFVEAIGKLAAGRSSEDVDNGPVRTTEHDFCLIPELTLRVGYQFGESIWGTLGYQCTYLNNVDRPGRHDSYYFLHGLTIGFEKRF